MAALVDPTVDSRYPVVLGESILNKAATDVFTKVRYNHRPTLSSGSGPTNARLKPSQPGKTTSYDLSYTDGGSSYAYTGNRSVDDNQYVFHFDPARKVFVLDRVDSTFNMNVTCLPGSSDPAKLALEYPHLDSPKADATATTVTTTEVQSKPAAKEDSKNTAQQPKQPRRKAEKKQARPAKDMALSLPQPEPPQKEKKASKRVDKDEEDEEEDDDDGGLLVEYPGGNNNAAKQTDFSPAFPAFPRPRRFDDFMDQRDSEGDADGESDGEPDITFQLPSPVKQDNNQTGQAGDDEEEEEEEEGSSPQAAEAASPENENEAATTDMEDDLEKEMELAFGIQESQMGGDDGGGGGDGDESEISEED